MFYQLFLWTFKTYKIYISNQLNCGNKKQIREFPGRTMKPKILLKKYLFQNQIKIKLCLKKSKGRIK